MNSLSYGVGGTSATLATNPITSPPLQIPQVTREIDRNWEIINLLEDRCTLLCNRLSLISQPQPPQDTSSAQKTEESLVPLASTLRQQGNRLNNLYHELSNLIQLLEI